MGLAEPEARAVARGRAGQLVAHALVPLLVELVDDPQDVRGPVGEPERGEKPVQDRAVVEPHLEPLDAERVEDVGDDERDL